MRATLQKMHKFETFWWKSLDPGDRFFSGALNRNCGHGLWFGLFEAVLALPAAAPGCCNTFTIQLR
jgi:hypothetical protein